MANEPQPTHSPGPWHTEDNNGRIYVYAGREVVACFDDPLFTSWDDDGNARPSVIRANARLCRTAPNLFDALYALYNEVASDLELNAHTAGQRALQAAHDALAKITGEEDAADEAEDAEEEECEATAAPRIPQTDWNVKISGPRPPGGDGADAIASVVQTAFDLRHDLLTDADPFAVARACGRERTPEQRLRDLLTAPLYTFRALRRQGRMVEAEAYRAEVLAVLPASPRVFTPDSLSARQMGTRLSALSMGHVAFGAAEWLSAPSADAVDLRAMQEAEGDDTSLAYSLTPCPNIGALDGGRWAPDERGRVEALAAAVGDLVTIAGSLVGAETAGATV